MRGREMLQERILNQEGNWEWVVDIIKQWQEDNVPQVWIDRWLQGFLKRREYDETINTG